MSFSNRFKCMFLNETYKELDDSITSVNIPAIDTGFLTQPTPIVDIFIPGDSLEFSTLNITFMLDQDYSNWKMVMDWMFSNRNFRQVNQDLVYSDVSIQLGNKKKNMIYSVQLFDVFPIGISDIDLNTKIDDIDPLEFIVTFKINNLEHT